MKFGKFQEIYDNVQKKCKELGEKVNQMAPELKHEADEIATTVGDLNKAGSGINDIFHAHDVGDVGKGWQDASNSWDEGFSDYVRRKVIEEKGYPTDRELSKEEKEALEKDVKKAHEAMEAELREKIGENMFEFWSAVKNGSHEAMQGIDEYLKIKDIYKTPTSTGNLTDLCNKIQKTVQTTIDATQKVASAGQRVFKRLMHNNGSHTHSESVILNNLKNIGTSKIGIAATTLSGAAVGVNAMVAAFKTGGITGAVSSAETTYKSMRTQWDATQKARDQFFKDKEKIVAESAGGRHAFWNCGTPGGFASPIDESTLSILNEEDGNIKSTNIGDSNEDDKLIGGTEYVSEIIFLLDGKKASGNSMCVVGDVEYLLSNFQLCQSLLSPMTLSFTMMKSVIAEEDEKDVKYDVCKKIIGLDVEMTVKTSYSEKESKPASQFKFKGLITGVSSSRGGGGASSIYVTASTYDYMLQGAPNCRSFENKTLEEIVSVVAGSVKQLKCRISPRLKTPLPYIVQFNQPDYDFLADLARRFGEWMYHSGTEFIFGEIVPPSEEVVKMRYPSGNLFTHGVDLRLRDMNILHVAPNMYQYGKDGVLKLSDDGKADRNSHELNDAAFERVKKLYANQAIYYPHVGGFNDNGEEEGTKEILENSIKVVSRGKRAQMLITNGDSKVAKLFIGQQFQIEDGVENVSTDKGEVDQHPMMVLDVTHTFGLDQNYGNVFDALPPSCDYPPYGNSDIYTTAYPQRATVMANGDPMDLGRVRVQFPWQKVQDNGEEKMWTPWIRIVTAYAGLSKGSQFVPELKEEVMVGFEMGNVERPFVIGSLFNGTQNPDPEWRARVVEGTANNIKAIRTSSGHTLQFCDEGGGGSIQMYDYGKNNYSIHLDSDGKYIRIEAKGDVQISAGNDVGIKAAHNISIQAGDNISMESGKDTDISADANMSVSAKDNMQQQATDIYVKASDSISEQSGNSHIIKTTTLQEKSSAKTSLDGGGLIEITAGKVDIR